MKFIKALLATVALLLVTLSGFSAFAAPAHGGEDSLRVPDQLDTQQFFGIAASHLLLSGLVVSALGIAFGLVIFFQLKNLPVHKSMLEVSELIYETCKTYLFTQAKFLGLLWVFIGAVIVIYYGVLKGEPASTVVIILLFSILGIAGSALVALFGIRVNTFANSRTAFAALRGKPYPVYAIPLKAGMSIGMLLISIELAFMLMILCLVPHEYAGKCFIGFAIGESLGAAALRVAGGIFTKIADIGSDLMKIVFKIKEDDARNPGVIADCTGDNAGDSVGPSADGFETYGVTGVALIVFILLAVQSPTVQVQLLTWIFVMRVLMIISSALSYFVNETLVKARYGNADKMNFEAPLTQLVWVTSIVSVIFTFIASYLLIPMLADDDSQWWKLSAIITCGTLAGAIIPELVKVFTSTESAHVAEVVTSSKEGGASLNILSGLTAGNFSAFWLGIVMMALMAVGYFVSQMGLGATMTIGGMDVSPVFAFGLVAFGFLGMGPVTLAVDSYGPVTDNAQSVYELSCIEGIADIKAEVKKDFGFDLSFDKAKHMLEENDGAGNTFKATAKPVLIGTAVVGATTMIFAIIVLLTDGLTNAAKIQKLSLLHPPFLLGLIAGGSVIYWFTGASTQAVTTGAYRAVEFIKANIKLEGVEKASIADSKKVVEICTTYAQKGMFNIFLVVFFMTLAFAFLDPFFFVGYLISIALFGLFQALFMANAGGAWDNAKKIVEVELKAKGTPLHDACVVGDTVGDPFKDTSSVAMNPIIKFTTLFGLLAVELANDDAHPIARQTTAVVAAVCFAIAIYFVWRSFYGMRIEVMAGKDDGKASTASEAKPDPRGVMKVVDLVGAMEDIAPTRLAASWDNVGLLVGDPAAALSRVLLTIDLTRPVLEEAVAARAEAVVAYHPPIFAAQKRFVGGSVAFEAARAGLAVYSPHTALDVAAGGTNDVLAAAVGMKEWAPLRSAGARETEVKLVTFVPVESVEAAAQAVFAAGAGHIGKYSSCSFRTAGTGTFFGDAGADPAVGEAGRLESVAEVRLETVVPLARLDEVVKALRAAHPYEEPAFDLLRLAPQPGTRGLGCVGAVEGATVAAIVTRLKAALGVEHVLVAGDTGRKITRVAVCAGSGGDLVEDAIASGAQLLVTGELRHHDALRVVEAGLVAVCTRHSTSERAALVPLRARLSALLPGVTVACSTADREPFAFT